MVYVKKFKAAIINPDRTITVKYVSKKNKLGSNAFKLSKKGETGEVYIIDPAHTIITTTKRLGVPFNYQTCYYKKNVPVPVPINDMDGGQSKQRLRSVTDEKGVTVQELIVNHPLPIPEFDNMMEYDHISAEELAVLFNPQFYKMIAKANTNKKEEQLWLMQIGSLAGIAFIIYYMIQTLPKSLVGAIGKYLGGG